MERYARTYYKMPATKRKFAGSGRGGYSQKAKRPRMTTMGYIRAQQAGYVRTGGYYGRYNAPRSRTELKFFDLDIDDAVVTAAGTIAEDSCCGIAEGTGEQNRIGRMCDVKSINWKYKIALPASAVVGREDTVRVILYLDRQANGATAAVTDILESDDFQSFNNLSNSRRFMTLMDRQHTLMSAAGAGDGTTNDSGPVSITGSLYKAVNVLLEYSNTTGAITELRSNNIGVLLISESGICSFESKMRLRFTG